MNAQFTQILNPTNEQRQEMTRNTLEMAGRPEDYENIVRLLSPPPDITNYAQPGELKGVKIGVVGGGLAGLSAAFELRKLGADITILDANDSRIGGRVYPTILAQNIITNSVPTGFLSPMKPPGTILICLDSIPVLSLLGSAIIFCMYITPA